MGRLQGIATRSASRAPMAVLDTARVTIEAGVESDSRGRPGERQVTVLAREAWDVACGELGVELAWTLRRANLLVEGLSLALSAGRRIRIGSLVLEVTGETEPCRNMDRQHPGLRAVLQPDWRGGATCRVIEAGRVTVGDEAVLEEG